MKTYYLILLTTIILFSCEEKPNIKQAQTDPIAKLYKTIDKSGGMNIYCQIVINKEYKIDTLQMITSHILSKLNKKASNIDIKYFLPNTINIRNSYANFEKRPTEYKLIINDNSKIQELQDQQNQNNIKPQKSVNISQLYSIIKENKGATKLDNFKIEYMLRIQKEFNKDTLDLIANDIKSKAPSDRPYVFVSYYLPNMVLGTGHYALSKRTPDSNETTIYMVKSENLPKASLDKNKEIIGVWRMSMGTSTIYKKNGSYYMEDKYIDGSGGTEKLKIVTRHGRKGYCYVEDGRELYVISNGQLNVYDEFGDLGAVFSAI